MNIVKFYKEDLTRKTKFEHKKAKNHHNVSII